MSIIEELVELSRVLGSKDSQIVINASVTIASLQIELKQAETILNEIKNLDFRGNREQGIVLAFKYFENQK